MCFSFSSVSIYLSVCSLYLSIFIRFHIDVLDSVIMSNLFHHVTRLQAQQSAEKQWQTISFTSQTSLLSAALANTFLLFVLFMSSNDDSIDITFRSEQIILLYKKQIFCLFLNVLRWICQLSVQDQYSLLKKLNIYLNQQQIDFLNV